MQQKLHFLEIRVNVLLKCLDMRFRILWKYDISVENMYDEKV